MAGSGLRIYLAFPAFGDKLGIPVKVNAVPE
jgi:hypothetical protein